MLDQRQIMGRIEDDVFPLPAWRMMGNDVAAAADHDLIVIVTDPDVVLDVGVRHGIGVVCSGRGAGVSQKRWLDQGVEG